MGTWKLLAVMIGAALVGWLVVGSLGRAPDDETSPAVATAPSEGAPAGDEADLAEPPITGDASVPQAHEFSDAAMEREFSALARALARDAVITNYVFPLGGIAPARYGIMKFRRFDHFWAPAFSARVR
jgi:hypothetical protein